MKLSDLEQLKAQIADEIRITETNVSEKILQLSSMYHRYLDYYSKELQILKKMSVDKDKLYGEIYHKTKFDSDFHFDSKTEIDIYVKKDEKYYNLSVEYQNQEVVVKYFEQLLDVISKSTFSIKNYIDYTKLRNGLS